jgi:membrane dipeptidase
VLHLCSLAHRSVYVPCANDLGLDDGVNFTNPTYRVRDTLEQIDVAHLLMDKYSDVCSCAYGQSVLSLER